MSALIGTIVHLAQNMAISDWRTCPDTDRMLIHRFNGRPPDERAFCILILRYSEMVQRECLRILSDVDRVEEAVEATFLVLSKRARSVRWEDRIEGWLRVTARNTALATRSRKRPIGGQVKSMDEFPERCQSLTDLERRELGKVLEEEIERLPEVEREAFKLVYGEKKSLDDAAPILGLSRGGLKHRLERAKVILRGRLARRGYGWSSLPPVLLGRNDATKAMTVSRALTLARAAVSFAAGSDALEGIAPAVICLAKAVLKGRLPLIKVVLMVGLVGIAAGSGLAYWVIPSETPPEVPNLVQDQGKLDGTWAVASVERDGKVVRRQHLINLKNGRIFFPTPLRPPTYFAKTMQKQGRYKLDASKMPKALDFVALGEGGAELKVWKGIYELAGDSLIICFSAPDSERPDQFVTQQGDGRELWKLLPEAMPIVPAVSASVAPVPIEQRSLEPAQRGTVLGFRAPRGLFDIYAGIKPSAAGTPDSKTISIQRAKVRSRPTDAVAHYWLGSALLAAGWASDEAVAELREAVGLKPDFAIAYAMLGKALLVRSQFSESLEMSQRALQLGYRPAGEQMLHCKRLLELDDKFRQYQLGRFVPTETVERIELARYASQFREYDATAVRLYEEAFAADPGLADHATHGPVRYLAAKSAARVGCRMGKDAINVEEETVFRGKALKWLRDELSSLASQGRGGPEGAVSFRSSRPPFHATFQRWQRDQDLRGVRDPALAKLPDVEREAWRALWREVKGLEEQPAK